MSQALYELFRRNVRDRMGELGINQTALAERLGMNRSYVSQLLSEGQHRRPGLETLETFANALETTPSELISEKSKIAG